MSLLLSIGYYAILTIVYGVFTLATLAPLFTDGGEG